jgi:hypothetical protein
VSDLIERDDREAFECAPVIRKAVESDAVKESGNPGVGVEAHGILDNSFESRKCEIELAPKNLDDELLLLSNGFKVLGAQVLLRILLKCCYS